MPGATARGANAAGIERLGDTGQASDARSLDGPNDRQHIGGELIGRGTGSPRGPCCASQATPAN